MSEDKKQEDNRQYNKHLDPFDEKVVKMATKYIPNNIDPLSLPDFAKHYYNFTCLDEKDKKMFWSYYLEKYLNNNDFRRSQQGLYIYIVKNKFFGIMTEEDEPEFEEAPTVIEITDNPTIYYLY